MVVLIDRQQGGSSTLEKNGLKLHSALNLTEIVDILVKHGKVTEEVSASVKQFVADNQITVPVAPAVVSPVEGPILAAKPSRLPYGKRAEFCQNPTGKKLWELIERKKSNLSLAADVPTAAELLKIADAVINLHSTLIL